MSPGTAILGTYAYMSAKQAEDPHAADAASDLYSLGCTFYHCLTGQVPFPDKNPIRQMLRHAGEQPRPLTDFDPNIPQVVQDVVSYLLAKSRSADRYGSAEETAAAAGDHHSDGRFAAGKLGGHSIFWSGFKRKTTVRSGSLSKNLGIRNGASLWIGWD